MLKVFPFEKINSILFRKEEESKLQELQAKFLEVVEAQIIQVIRLEEEITNRSKDRLVAHIILKWQHVCFYYFRQLDRLRYTAKYLEDKYSDIQHIVIKLEDCLVDLDGDIANIMETVKTLKEKVDRYDDIDTVIEKTEAKVAEMKHKGKGLDKTINVLYHM